MEFHSFPATLHAHYQNIQEFGYGTLLAQDDALDFTGDFIPLLPLGSDAVVDWTLGDRAVASFEGKVYLSTSGLLRIVNIDTTLAANARKLFARNTYLPAHASIPGGHGRRQTRSRPVPAHILYLSGQSITLQVSDSQLIGQNQLLLDCEVDFLTLCNLQVNVEHSLLLQRQEILLICSLPKPSEENLIALSAYTARLEQLAGR